MALMKILEEFEKLKADLRKNGLIIMKSIRRGLRLLILIKPILGWKLWMEKASQ